MSDEPFDMVAALEAQAKWKREQQAIEASLSPLERKLRAKFEAAINGPEVIELNEFRVSDPTTLLVFAEAYRREGIDLAFGKKTKEAQAIREPYETAMFTCVAIWMAIQGHEEFIEHFSHRVRMPMIPLPPRDWWTYREQVYAGMGLEAPTWPKVTVLKTPLTQGMAGETQAEVTP